MHPNLPQQPFFIPIKRQHLTEEDLNKGISVVSVKVYGSYTARGEHRKEIVELQYEGEVEVPEGFNRGHVKLAVNRYIKNTMKGIRARTYYLDEDSAPKKLEHKRKVRDFISSRGIRDNDRLKREWERANAQRKAEMERMANGEAPMGIIDDSVLGGDGLPKFSEKTYVAQ